MTLTRLSAASRFRLEINASGWAEVQFRSTMTSAGGSARALSSRSCSDLMNSTSMPARLAASWILTMKNKSSTTARIRRGLWAIHHNPVFLFQAFDAHRRKLPDGSDRSGDFLQGRHFQFTRPRPPPQADSTVALGRARFSRWATAAAAAGDWSKENMAGMERQHSHNELFHSGRRQ